MTCIRPGLEIFRCHCHGAAVYHRAPHPGALRSGFSASPFPQFPHHV